ncbi:MAG: autotransporter-associated beta strand repeat-containing protein [Luteolibacter sp.]
MKPKYHLYRNFPALLASSSLLVFVSFANATSLTWDGAPDGGGTSADAKWSTVTNWLGDTTVPAATGDTLTFGGTTNLNAQNDSVTALATSGTAITFASGAGSFNLSGNTLTLGSGGGGGQTIVSQQSANAQTISTNINLSGGSGDRSIVFATGAGSLTISGNINFSNDWLFPNTTAGTIILSGTNTGNGKLFSAGGITAGTNKMNAMMRNNVLGTQVVLGSDSALGNSGTGSVSAGTADFRGIRANQPVLIGTAGGDRNLSGSTLAINSASIEFNGANNLTLGNLINESGNRDFKVSAAGQVTVQNSLSLSSDQTGRSLYLNLSGAGGMIVNGPVYDTFHSGGLTTPGSGTLRKAGTATLTLNGDSSYTDLTTIEAGTLKIGHVNALGATGTTNGTTLTGNATLDLNGLTIGESLTFNNNGNKLANSSATAAAVTVDVTLNTSITVDATGDITATRLISNATRIVNKQGIGTLTTNGTSHNNLCGWDIQAGTVVLANTSGYGADRSVTLNGGTLQLSGANFDLINNAEAFTINSGTFDLTGKNEAVASIGGSGGTITNSVASTTSTLFVGGGSGGTSSASFAGTVQNGAGTLALTKEGSGIQTLTGTLAYSGTTTISAGTLSLSTASLNDASTLSITTATGTLDLTHSGTDVVAAMTVDGNPVAAGVYGSAASGAANIVSYITGTGKIQVGAPAGYAGWAASHGTSAIPSEDTDSDGVANAVEYFMNAAAGFTTNPPVVVSAGPVRTVTWTNGGNIPASAYGTQFWVQTSTDLVSWTDVPTGSLTTNTDGPGGSITYTLTGTDKSFARLKVKPN